MLNQRLNFPIKYIRCPLRRCFEIRNMKNTGIISLVFSALIFSITGIVYSEENHPDSYYETILNNAKHAIEEGDEEKADFYLARYIGLTLLDKNTKRNLADLNSLFARYKVAKPTSFISGKYNKDFLDWFIFASHAQWGIDDEGVDEQTYSFEITSNSDGKYFASIIAYPWLEGWLVIKDNPSIAVLVLGDFKRKPYIISGILENGTVIKRFPKTIFETDQHPIQYVWPPEFHDLDGDGTPEIWIRYNATWADGFAQLLNIYKIDDDNGLTLFKKFTGNAEGIARRLDGNMVEVARGFTDKGGVGHLGYDKHHFEIWRYEDGNFKKISERDIPHILRSNEWKKYYLNTE